MNTVLRHYVVIVNKKIYNSNTMLFVPKPEIGNGCTDNEVYGIETIVNRVKLVGYLGAQDMYYADPNVGAWGEIREVDAPLLWNKERRTIPSSG